MRGAKPIPPTRVSGSSIDGRLTLSTDADATGCTAASATLSWEYELRSVGVAVAAAGVARRLSKRPE